MKAWVKVIIVTALVLAVAAVVVSKQRTRSSALAAHSQGQQLSAEAALSTDSKAAVRLPRLLDLGSTTCTPCQMMVPILKALAEEHKGRFDVEVVDVAENPAAAEKYGIRVIPTQVFLDPSGKEIFRHEGFYPKNDILAKWKELGVTLQPAAPGGGK